ncbi:uncharacterized protein LOC143163703 isoform X3 [Aptenodytes patagonicus]|uniref:uncharacterized protein LOC143163703 isoform X3 n=1 Tax=Aptenodytes patagonicus TaxID=9234 RepID=UPI003FA033E6
MRFWAAPACSACPPSAPPSPGCSSSSRGAVLPRRAPAAGRPRTMPREALLLLAWLAPLLAFPTAAPDLTASYLEGTTTEATGFTQSFTEEGITKIFGEVTSSGSRGRRSEYSEPSIISTEQYVQKRTSVEHSISLNEGSVIGDPQGSIYREEDAGGKDQP